MSLGKCEASPQRKSVSCYADYIQLLDQERNTLSIFIYLLTGHQQHISGSSNIGKANPWFSPELGTALQQLV